MGNDEERLMSGEAWRDFCRRLEAVGESILAEGFPAGPQDRAEGFRWLTRLVTHATRMEIEAGDPDHPVFVRYETPHNQWGGPNPDLTYLRANVDPAKSYRIWADVRGVRQALFSLNEGEMQLGEFGVFSERSLDDLTVDSDGLLELRLSPEEQPGNWLPTHPDGRLFTVRVFQSDWERDAGPVFHIERIGSEGIPPPFLDPGLVARGLDRSATWIERTATFWNHYTTEGWHRATPNVANPPASAPGGADHILYGSCFWELEAQPGAGAGVCEARRRLLGVHDPHARLARVGRFRRSPDQPERSAGAHRRRRQGQGRARPRGSRHAQLARRSTAAPGVCWSTDGSGLGTTRSPPPGSCRSATCGPGCRTTIPSSMLPIVGGCSRAVVESAWNRFL